MPLWLGTHTCSAGLAIFLDEFTESGPGVVATDEVDGFVLTGVSGEDMIVLVTEDTESEIVRVGNVYEIVVSEESVGGDGPTGLRIFEVVDV